MKWGIYDTCMGKQQLVCRASDLRIGDFFVDDLDSWLMAVRFQVIEIENEKVIGQAFYKGELQLYGQVAFESKTWVHYLEGENERANMPDLPDRGEEWIKETWKEIDNG